jgi:transposase InsO family protein
MMTLQMAIDATPENKRIWLIHHSDRGAQYCCRDYVKLLKSNHIHINMTENGDPYENAVAERMNGILKAEWLNMEEYADFLQAQERISQIINTYNKVRLHASCNMLTPMEAELHKGKLKKRWRKRKHEQKEIKTVPS